MSSADSLTPVWELGSLPFHVGPRPKPSNDGFPDRLPFTVGVDGDTGLLVQVPDPAVEAALEKVYTQGIPIGTPLAEDGLGQRCLADFLSFVRGTVGRERFDGLSILEIGSGAGAMLKALHDLGATVVGVEPGADRNGELPYTVIRQPFRPDLFDDGFDLIIHYAVAEHIRDPLAFVSAQLSLLKPEGAIAFAVPDCTLPLHVGDISMFIHEHWSYFTEETLAAIASIVGASVVRGAPAGVGGLYYSAWVPTDASTSPARSSVPYSFAERASRNIERIRAYLTDLRDGGRELGIYCPGRFINYEAVLAGSLPTLRYFDDDPWLDGLYYPPSSVPVEPRSALLKDPPSHVFIASWSFGSQILESLRSDRRLDGVEITTMAELLGA